MDNGRWTHLSPIAVVHGSFIPILIYERNKKGIPCVCGTSLPIGSTHPHVDGCLDGYPNQLAKGCAGGCFGKSGLQLCFICHHLLLPEAPAEVPHLGRARSARIRRKPSESHPRRGGQFLVRGHLSRSRSSNTASASNGTSSRTTTTWSSTSSSSAPASACARGA